MFADCSEGFLMFGSRSEKEADLFVCRRFSFCGIQTHLNGIDNIEPELVIQWPGL